MKKTTTEIVSKPSITSPKIEAKMVIPEKMKESMNNTLTRNFTQKQANTVPIKAESKKEELVNQSSEATPAK